MIGLKSGPGGGAVRSKVLEFKKGCVEMKMWGKDGSDRKKWCSNRKKWCLGMVFESPLCGAQNVDI